MLTGVSLAHPAVIGLDRRPICLRDQEAYQVGPRESHFYIRG